MKLNDFYSNFKALLSTRLAKSTSETETRNLTTILHDITFMDEPQVNETVLTLTGIGIPTTTVMVSRTGYLVNGYMQLASKTALLQHLNHTLMSAAQVFNFFEDVYEAATASLDYASRMRTADLMVIQTPTRTLYVSTDDSFAPVETGYAYTLKIGTGSIANPEHRQHLIDRAIRYITEGTTE